MRLGFDRLWLILAVALPALVALLVPLPAVDLAYQVRAGDEILRSGALPGVDTYTFTVAGAAWTDQQWLAQVILAGVFRLGGWELLAVLRAALVAGSFGLLAAVAAARGAGARSAAILSLVAFALAAPALALRPQLLAIAVFACLLVLVARRDRQRRVYWLAPIFVVAWANLHGSFVLAPVLLGYAWLDDLVRGRPARGSLLVLVAGTAATLVNPFGAGVWAYAAGIGTNPGVSGQVTEWQRTTPFTVPGLLFYVSAVAAAVASVLGRARLRWPDGLLLLAMFAIAAWAIRGLAWWPLGAVFVLAPVLARSSASSATAPDRPARAVPERAGLLNAVLALLLGVVVIAALPWWRPADPLTGRVHLLTYAPSGLASELRSYMPGNIPPNTRIYVPQVWASWFEWAVPGSRYFLDSRFELFPKQVWDDEAAFESGGSTAAEAAGRWQVLLVVLPAGAPAPSGGWAEIYRDADGAIYAPQVRFATP